jgi:hypothetical protein
MAQTLIRTTRWVFSSYGEESDVTFVHVMVNVTAAEPPMPVPGPQPRVAFHTRQRRLMLGDATGRTDRGPSLCAECVACGAKAPDWRGLLGVGAVMVTCSRATNRKLLTYPFACAECGGSELELTSLSSGVDGVAC